MRPPLTRAELPPTCAALKCPPPPPRPPPPPPPPDRAMLGVVPRVNATSATVATSALTILIVIGHSCARRSCRSAYWLHSQAKRKLQRWPRKFCSRMGGP